MSNVVLEGIHTSGGSERLLDCSRALPVAPVGIVGTTAFAAYWADMTYAAADVWTSATGCNYFEVRAGTSLATPGDFLCIAWSTTEDDDLSAPLAAIGTGTASVAKTAKETTLTSSSNVGVLKSNDIAFAVYSETAIKTIKMIGVGHDLVALLYTTTL